MRAVAQRLEPGTIERIPDSNARNTDGDGDKEWKNRSARMRTPCELGTCWLCPGGDFAISGC